jgi:hypothetical protein
MAGDDVQKRKRPRRRLGKKAAEVAGRLRIRLLDVTEALVVALLHVDLRVGHWRPFGVEDASGQAAGFGDQVVAVAKRAVAIRPSGAGPGRPTAG